MRESWTSLSRQLDEALNREDALRARIRELEAERDHIADERKMLRAENTRLREALERYGGHLRWCPVRFEQYDECNCGLVEALEVKP